MSWPEAHLDPVRRLRVLAGAVPGAAYAEAVLDAPFDAVWDVVTDFEGGVPRFETFVRRQVVLAREGERVRLRTTTPLGSAAVDVVLRPGWCWMQSSLLVIGMAAVADGTATRFAHLEALRRPALARLARPLIGLKLPGELRSIERLARLRE